MKLIGKKMLVFLLIVIMCCSNVLILNVYANNVRNTISGICGDGIEWTYDVESSQLTISGTGEMYNYTTTNNYYTGITTDVPWEDYLSSITKVKIENGVTSIGNSAFSDCSSLSNIDLPSTLLKIGKNTFARCTALRTIYLPDTVIEIGESSFAGCNQLINIDIPDGVTKLEQSTFSACSKLESVTLPKGLISIGLYVFNSCSNLSEIVLPDTLKSIGSDSFFLCKMLKKIIIPKSVETISSEAFYNCNNLKEITLYNDTIKIGSNAFKDCSSNLILYGNSDSATEIYAAVEGIRFVCLNPEDTDLHIKSFNIDKESGQNIGEQITLTVKASGGSMPYQYMFYYTKDNDKEQIILKYSSNANTVFKFQESGNYQIGVRVKDSNGTIAEKKITNFKVHGFQNFAGGDGTEENPFQITDAIMFREMENQLDANYILMSDIDLKGWIRVDKFGGTLDGNGHTITTTYSKQYGMFNILDENAVIKNCIVNIGYNTNIELSFGSIALKNYGSIVNCTSKGTVYNMESNVQYTQSDGFYVGGICSTNYGEIKKCRNDINITIRQLLSPQGCFIGGISGAHGDCIQCINTGNLNIGVSKDAVNSGYYSINIGGVTGYGNLRECANIGNVQLSYIASYDFTYFYGGIIEGREFCATSHKTSCQSNPDCFISDDITFSISCIWSGSGGGINNESYFFEASEISQVMIKTRQEILEWWDNLLDSKVELGNISTVSNNDIVTQVYDIGDGLQLAQPMKDAAVNVDKFGSASTDEKGKAIITNNLTDQPLVNTKISITKEGYREYYFYKDIYNKDAELLWNSNQQMVHMRKLQNGDKSNPYISTLMCQASYGKIYDAMTTGQTYRSMGSAQNIKIQMNAVWNGKTPASYILYQENGISYTSADGTFQLDMGEDFKARYPIYAKLVAADGTTVTEKTRIEIKGSSASSSSENSLDLIDTDSTGTLGEDVAFLSGQNVNIKLGGAKLDVSVQAGKIRATIGKKNKDLSTNGEMFSNEEWEEWKKLCEHQPTDLNLSQWKNVIESIETDWTGSVKGDTDVYGYLEGTVNDAGSTLLSGKLKIKASVSASLQSQYMVGVVPVYAKVSIGVDGAAEGTLSYNWTEKKIDIENTGLTLSLEPYLAAEGGVGVMAVATVGVEGKGSLPFSTKIGSNDATKLSLKGGLSFKVKLLAFEYSLKLAEKEMKLLPKEKSRAAAQEAEISQLSMNDFQLSDNSYLDKESLWLGDSAIQPFSLETTETGAVERVLKTNVNPDADMQVVTAGDTKMILWTEGDPKRTSINSSKLVYSIYNAADDTWSVPEAVADDGTADFAPSAVSDGEHIYVAWQNISREFADNTGLSEVAAASTAAMSVWTAGEGFSEAAAVSEAGCMAVTPKIALNAEGKPYVAYLQNTDNNLLLTTGQNHIRYSIIDGGSIEHKVFAENAGLVAAMDTSYTDGYEVSYTLDKDNDLSTLEDREIVKKGTADAATQNDCLDSNAQYVKNGGRTLRFWYRDESIVMSDMDGNETVVYQDDTGALTDDFHVVSGQENQLAVIWTAVDKDGNKQIGGSLYDPDKNIWSKSIQISDTDANVYNPQGIFTEDGSLQFLYKKTGETQTDLCVLMAKPSVNLTVENAYCDETLLVPGSTAKVSVQIKNNGSKNADGFTLDIEGTKTAISESLAPGESIIAEADYAVPADISYQEIHIAVEVDGDIDTSDNQFSLPIGHTDLAVNVTDNRLAFGQLVEVHTANQSCVDTAATLEVRKDSREGDLIKSIDLGIVKKGELVTATYLWNEEAENYSAEAETLYFNVVSEKQEKYIDNNYDFIAVEKTNDTPTCAEHTWSEGTVTKAPTCTQKGEKEYTCTVCGETKTEELKETAHTYKTVLTKATTAKNGSTKEQCSSCGKVKNQKTIFAVKSAALKTSSYIYNGKKKKPSVTVKNSRGKVIGKGNYTLTYKNNIKVGKATVTIKLKGNYKGTLTKTFQIVPKGTSISGKIMAKSKGLTVKWKKQPKSTTGYQIQVSASKKFAKKATVTKTVKKNSVTKLTVKKLKPKKKYYVRIRTYKTVKGKKYCSSWSKAKTVTTKK